MKKHLIKYQNNKIIDVDVVKLYYRVIDSLLYLANDTRYDITFTCQYFIQYMAHPYNSH